MRKFLLIPVCFVLVIMFIIVKFTWYDNPKVDITANMVILSDEEYKYVGTHGIENPTKDDFINFHFRLKITNIKNMKTRNVYLPNFREVINGYDTERYWAGESAEQNVPNEDFLYYENNYLIFKRGLDTEQLKEVYSKAEVKIILVNEKGRKYEYNYNIGDIIKFQ